MLMSVYGAMKSQYPLVSMCVVNLVKKMMAGKSHRGLMGIMRVWKQSGIKGLMFLIWKTKKYRNDKKGGDRIMEF